MDSKSMISRIEEAGSSKLSGKPGSENKTEDGSPSRFNTFCVETLIPLALILTTPNFCVCISYFVTQLGSQLSLIDQQGYMEFWLSSWKAASPSSLYAWSFVLVFGIWAALSVLLPLGRTYKGPPTTNGFQPTYRDNGFYYYMVTCLLSVSILCSGMMSSSTIYRHLPELTGVLILFGIVICLGFLLKGHFGPSPGDHGTSGNPLFDFYWGMELYPRIGTKFDLKMWTNCRFGMMLWQLIVFLSWMANHERNGFSWSMSATTILQTIYIAKFYWWEAGYMNSIDIILDRAGFYVCWGCIAFVPVFYTLTSVYMVDNAPSSGYGPLYFALNVSLGLSMILCNYWADHQRQLCPATNGNCRIWGRPARIIRAKYLLLAQENEVKERVLLASGFWGWSRHSNYLFEILGALSWSLPSLFLSPVPYFYFIFLIVLLVHRSFRDENKCRNKYGTYWTEYCKITKYQLVPYVI